MPGSSAPSSCHPRRKAGTFSGGMKVKLALAMALAHRPELLVLDEPTAGLDPVARREFLEMISAQAVATGRTTFFSTHLVDEVELAAGRIGVVDQGRTLFQGTAAELASRVRLLQCPVLDPDTPPPLPPPLEEDPAAIRLVRDELRQDQRVVVATGPPERLEAWAGRAPRWTVTSLDLEEAFIELVGQRASSVVGAAGVEAR